MPLYSLMLLEQAGLQEVTLPCAACFNRFRAATRDLRLDPKLKVTLEHELGATYHDSVTILSLLELIVERIGLEEVGRRVQRPLEGLKVVCYYGCRSVARSAVGGPCLREWP